MKEAGLTIKTLKSVIPQGEASDAAIYRCMQVKYSKPFYRTLLLSTGDRVLHESPMWGNGNEWTFPGGDKLGMMLVRLRSEIRNALKN